jgi:hypothetical protein
MRYIAVIILTLFILCFAEIYQIEWVRIIDNGSDDGAFDVDVDNLNNIIVTGYSVINGTQDIFTVKYDPAGNILWADTFDYNNSSDQAHGVAIDRNDNILITGNTVFNNWKYLTIKLDRSGTIIWADTINTGNYELAEDITVDSLDNIAITGVSYIPYGLPSCVSLKYDSNGIVLWGDTVNYGEIHSGYGVAIDNNNNIIVASTCNIELSHEDVVILKYDPSGTLLNVDTLDHDGGRDQGRDIIVDNNNCVVVVGTIIDYPYHGFVVKYNSSDSILWEDIIGRGLYAVDVDSANNIVVAGYAYTSGSYGDYLIVKYDSLGTILWQDILDIGYWDYAYGAAFDKAGNIIVTGETTINSQTDYCTVKYEYIGGIAEESNIITTGTIKPITWIISGPIILPKEKHCRVFDITGREVNPTKVSLGIYFIEANGCIIGKEIKIR